MSLGSALIIFVGGLFAGFVNALAGGGSLLTVPLLGLAGVDGLIANGTNRVAVLLATISTGVGFARGGYRDLRQTLPVLVPAMAGGTVGALVIASIEDVWFKRIFGIVMIPLLILSLRPPKPDAEPTRWPVPLSVAVFFLVGMYAGAIQAGVGLILLLILNRAGHDLVTGNAIKNYVVIGVSLIAVPIFLANDQVRWLPAFVLSAGTMTGGYIGANSAISGGERIIKPVLAVSVVILAGRMLGLY
ncbi:MAG: sulfite exporter TauE/SafE family protein [Acidimicrobiales bacterium]|nr:sulfite exporter TauE/SafE family protein [Acidimicrobiales bacterium]